MIEPDPEFQGTSKWREHKAPTEDVMYQVHLRTIEAWRDYLYSGRVEGTRQLYYDGAVITITVDREEP